MPFVEVLREEELDLGFGVPTRLALVDRARGHHEVELQVRLDAPDWERVLSFAPPLGSMTEDAAFEKGRELAKKNGPKFFEPWRSRRSTAIANAAAAKAAEDRKAAQYEKAAPLRAAYAAAGLDELARRADRKASEAEADAQARPDDPAMAVP